MEDKNMDFLDVESCVEVKKAYPLSKTRLSYVYSCEETDIEDFDLNGDIDGQITQIEDETGISIEI
jgi:hypothetical protein